jgi:hypothetical protein
MYNKAMMHEPKAVRSRKQIKEEQGISSIYNKMVIIEHQIWNPQSPRNGQSLSSNPYAKQMEKH